MTAQAERSRATRGRLLEAAVECLVERGYFGTSTAEVCRRAGATRGAQLHHYPTKAALLGAAVEHVMGLRHAEFRAGLGAGPADLGAVLERLWGIYAGPTLAAWQELVVAARTDAELRDVVARVNARFLGEAEATFAAIFGAGASADAAAATRLVLAVFDGLALNHVLEPDGRTPRRVLRELRRLIAPWGRGGGTRGRRARG